MLPGTRKHRNASGVTIVTSGHHNRHGTNDRHSNNVTHPVHVEDEI